MKGSGFGFWVDMLLGIAGAFVGGFIAGHLGFAAYGGIIYTLIIAIVGAIMIVFLFPPHHRKTLTAHRHVPPRSSLSRRNALVFAIRRPSTSRKISLPLASPAARRLQ